MDDDYGAMIADLAMSKRLAQSPMRRGNTAIPYDPSTLNLGRAVKELKLTPQEQNLYYHGIQNMRAGKTIQRANGATSSISQAVVTGPDGRFYNIPTVWDGVDLPWQEAAKRAAAVGWDKWPAYATPEQADNRYINEMHPYMDLDVQQMQSRK